jgi:phospholipid/cholesterol/gamma-HCH transport system ATP-binding protein
VQQSHRQPLRQPSPRRPSHRPSGEPPIVEIQDLGFAYDPARPVLRDVNMTIPRGSVVGIMGQSGCGKTTLLRIIAAGYLPTRGRAKILGHSTGDLDRDGLYAMRRRMGMLFQFGALFTDLTVYENVAFPLREHADLEEGLLHDLVMLKLEAVGLRGAAHLMPAELSGGMGRRVALARSIALDPQLILYDEPFTGLDPIAFGVIGRLIRELNDSLGATSIIVTHDVQEALGVVDYVYFMADGRVIAQGTPEEIRASGEPFVNQFVNGKLEGPMPFQYPAPDYAADLGVSPA